MCRLKKRTVAYCKFEFVRKGLVVKDFRVFSQVLEKLKTMSIESKTKDFEENDKVVVLDSIHSVGDGYLGFVFKTGRYGHTANLINKYDGSERNNNKTMDEGEIELTHLCMSLKSDHALCALEGNKYGISAPIIVKYFQQYINEIDENLMLNTAYVSTKGLSDILERASRIISVDVECAYKDLNEDAFENMYGPETKETFDVHFSPQRGKSLKKSETKKLYNKVDTNGKIRRIRVALRTDEGDDVILDSLMDKVRDRIPVEMDTNGVVISKPILESLKQYLIKIEEMI